MKNEFVDLGFRERRRKCAWVCLEMGRMGPERHEDRRKFLMNGILRLLMTAMYRHDLGF
jgi:hypothetical protein